MPFLYDVGVQEFSIKPKGTFGGVICTDVMEHIEIYDVDEILKDVIGYATKFVFFHIACRPSKRKRLPDGRDVHVTIQPYEWWDVQIHKHWREGLTILTKYDERKMG